MNNPNLQPSPELYADSIVSHIEDLLSEHSFSYQRTMRLRTDSSETIQCQETGCYRQIFIETGEGAEKSIITSVWFLSRTDEPDGAVYRVSTGFENGYVGVYAVDAQKNSLIAMYLGSLENGEQLPLYDKSHDLHFGVVDHPVQLASFDNRIVQSVRIDYSDPNPMPSELARHTLGRFSDNSSEGLGN